MTCEEYEVKSTNCLYCKNKRCFEEIEQQKKTELIKAMKEDRIVPFFQPIYNLSTNEIDKYELLMRIEDNDKFLSPFTYIQIAEKYDLIRDLDLMVMEKAFKYKAKVDKDDKITLSINLSGAVVIQEFFMNKVSKLVDKYNINHNNIVFEITETQKINLCDFAIDTIHDFKKKGFRFSIDDFGTGFTNVNYIKQLPVDFIKIDGEFIREINKSEENLYFVEFVIKFARKFGLQIVAEHIEDEEILSTLKDLGIEFGQGYYFGRPSQVFA